MTDSQHLTIKELPEDDRPRERLARLGAENVSDSDLLAIILRTGRRGETVSELSQRLLQLYGGLEGLGSMSLSMMRTIKGIKDAKATGLIAAFELGRRSAGIRSKTTYRLGAKTKINSPAAAAGLIMDEMSVLDREHLWVILLDTKKQFLDLDRAYSGSINSAPVRTAELFAKAVKWQAESVILAHNHPSGDPTPSPEDIEVTKRAVDAGNALEIDVVDHIVVGHGRYFSFREKKLVFGS